MNRRSNSGVALALNRTKGCQVVVSAGSVGSRELAWGGGQDEGRAAGSGEGHLGVLLELGIAAAEEAVRRLANGVHESAYGRQGGAAFREVDPGSGLGPKACGGVVRLEEQERRRKGRGFGPEQERAIEAKLDAFDLDPAEGRARLAGGAQRY